MKKTLAIACAAVLALALAGCASSISGSASGSAGASAAASTSSLAGSASASSASATAIAAANMANPWSSATSAEEAARGAGLESFDVADLGLEGKQLFDPAFQFMDGIAEATYQGGAFEVTVRKSTTVSGQELSGDYNAYPENWKLPVGDIEVDCQGYKGNMAASFTWSNGDANYAVTFRGLGGENMAIGEAEVEAIIEHVR